MRKLWVERDEKGCEQTAMKGKGLCLGCQFFAHGTANTAAPATQHSPSFIHLSHRLLAPCSFCLHHAFSMDQGPQGGIVERAKTLTSCPLIFFSPASAFGQIAITPSLPTRFLETSCPTPVAEELPGLPRRATNPMNMCGSGFRIVESPTIPRFRFLNETDDHQTTKTDIMWDVST
jgi:hypothetical protein